MVDFYFELPRHNTVAQHAADAVRGAPCPERVPTEGDPISAQRDLATAIGKGEFEFAVPDGALELFGGRKRFCFFEERVGHTVRKMPDWIK